MNSREGGVSVSPSFERKVVTSNIGRSNTIDIRDPRFTKVIDNTLEKIELALLRRCGPTAGYTMVVNGFKALGMFEPNMFTRDGIDILSAIEFMSPIEAIQKDIISYVGTRVEADSKDGTTTSMLFITKLLRKMNAMRDQVMNRGASIHDLNRISREVFTHIDSQLTRYRHTYEDLDKSPDNVLAGYVAYMQALSSSGGNYELAEAMQEVFRGTPRESWSTMIYRSSPKETDKIYSTEVSEYQDRISTMPNNAFLNEAMGTEYHASDVRVFIYTQLLDKFNADTDRIKLYLKEYPADKPILFVCPFVDGEIIAAVGEYNKTRTSKIGLMSFTPSYVYQGDEAFYELDIINARAGIHLPLHSPYLEDTEPCDDRFSFKCDKVIYRNGMLELYNYIEENDRKLHPFIVEPDKATPYFNEVYMGIQSGIQNNTGNHGNDARMLELFSDMYDKLIAVRRPYLRIGGTTHDHMAAVPVVRDVQGAIMASLRDGFLINGATALYSAIDDAKSKYMTEDGKYLNVLASDIFRCIYDSIWEIVAHIHEVSTSDDKAKETLSVYPNQYLNVLNTGKSAGVSTNILDYVKILKDDTNVTMRHEILCKNYPVLMPYGIVDELFKRTKELFPKYISTDTYIVTGGVVIEDEEDTDGTSTNS